MIAAVLILCNRKELNKPVCKAYGERESGPRGLLFAEIEQG